MNILQGIAVVLVIILIVIACFPKKKGEPYTFNYSIEKPTLKMEMPTSLKEISGLSFYKENQLACVNDEKGTVFIYNLTSQKVTETIDIGKNGDYEGIEVVDDEIFIMKSNGKIKGFRISDGSERKIDCSDKDVKEYEGLSYHPQTRSLLLVTKEKDKDKNDKKTIYSYSLSTEKFDKYLTINEDMIKGSDGKKTFAPSGIAVHPITGEVFVISSQGKKLLILSPEGEKNTLIELDPETFVQPEGICFTPNGDLYISSEGTDANGYILKFDYLKN
ncbi:SdiA-regulated domain-containing protein [Emticicia sp. W12TSBA100-4]|uniref:SdiA-regulated domain-containing protein n=1 Tax=Emticicia sp. W12TSBA100-4 TaxID=3160965 RepID=UPI003305C75D